MANSLAPKPAPATDAVVRYTPSAAVGNVPALRSLLTQFAPRIKDVLPRHLSADRMVRLVLHAAQRQPKLFECTQESLVESVMTAAQLGLECDGTRGEGYILPYWNGREKRFEARFQTGYVGLAKLARQSGEIKRLEAEVVYENDHFVFKKGTELVLDFQPALTGRGKPIGAYALAEFKDGGLQTEWMSVEQIERVQRASKGADSGDSPWKQWWDQMARKTVFRRLSKWLDLSSEKFNAARDYEATIDAEMDVVEESAEKPQPKALAARLAAVAERVAAPAEEEIVDPVPDRAPVSAPAEDEEVLYDMREQEEAAKEAATRAQRIGIACTEAALVERGRAHAAISLILGRAITSRSDIRADEINTVMPVLVHAGRKAKRSKPQMIRAWEELILTGERIDEEAIDRAIEAVRKGQDLPAVGGKPAISKGDQSRMLYSSDAETAN